MQDLGQPPKDIVGDMVRNPACIFKIYLSKYFVIHDYCINTRFLRY